MKRDDFWESSLLHTLHQNTHYLSPAAFDHGSENPTPPRHSTGGCDLPPQVSASLGAGKAGFGLNFSSGLSLLSPDSGHRSEILTPPRCSLVCGDHPPQISAPLDVGIASYGGLFVAGTVHAAGFVWDDASTVALAAVARWSGAAAAAPVLGAVAQAVGVLGGSAGALQVGAGAAAPVQSAVAPAVGVQGALQVDAAGTVRVQSAVVQAVDGQNVAAQAAGVQCAAAQGGDSAAAQAAGVQCAAAQAGAGQRPAAGMFFGSIPIMAPSSGSFSDAVNGNRITSEDNGYYEALRKNNKLTIVVQDPDYNDKIMARRNLCFIGRIAMGKNSTASYTLADLKLQVFKAWKFKDWSILAIGLGHYVFSFRNELDRNACYGKGKWNLEHGSALFLQDWKPKFIPSKPPKRPVSLVRVWVHFSGLCSEDFNLKTIRSLARALGNVVKVDMEAFSKGYGKVAKVLIDIDLSKSLEHDLLVETAAGNSLVLVKYLALPLYCKDCNSLGHNSDSCPRKNKSSADGAETNAAANSAPIVTGRSPSGTCSGVRTERAAGVRIMVDADGFEVPKYQERYRQWLKQNSVRNEGPSDTVLEDVLPAIPAISEAAESSDRQDISVGKANNTTATKLVSSGQVSPVISDAELSEAEESSDSQDAEDSRPVSGCPFNFSGLDNIVVVSDSLLSEQAQIGKSVWGDCDADDMNVNVGTSSLKSCVQDRQKKTWANLQAKRRASKRRGLS